MSRAVTVNQKEVESVRSFLNAFDSSKTQRSLNRAASTTHKRARTQVVRETGDALETYTQRVIRQSITSRARQQTGRIDTRGRPIPGHGFKNKYTGTKPRRGSRPVGTKWWDDTTLKTRKGYFRSQPKKYQRSPIFKRRGRARLPVDMLSGPTAFTAMAQGFKGERRLTDMADFTGRVYLREMERQLDQVLRGQ